MKVLALQGSPKKDSDTMHLLDAFLKGMGEHAPQDIETIHLIDKDIRPCRGCFFCWRSTELQCAQKDDALDIIGKILEADVVIWDFPLYFYGMPSHMKALLDRAICLEKLDMYQDETGCMRHGAKTHISAKQIILVGSGFPAPDLAIFQPLEQQLRYGLDSDAIFIGIQETPLLNGLFHSKDCSAYTEPLLQKITAAGAEFACHGSLSDDTLASLKIPMMPLDEYLDNINNHASAIVKK
jgi:putative NADPH-quinone reductase